MSYIDAIYERDRDTIHVVERASDGSRVYKQYPATYTFYYSDPKGKYRSVNNEPVSRFTTRKLKEFRREVKMHSDKRTYESDLNPTFRCLADNYLDVDPPKLHTCFFDIEVDWKPPEVDENVMVKIRKKK